MSVCACVLSHVDEGVAVIYLGRVEELLHSYFVSFAYSALLVRCGRSALFSFLFVYFTVTLSE